MDRLADPTTQLANMVEIEDHLRKKINLSEREWHVLLATSVKVSSYTEESDKRARAFADQDRASRKQNPASGNTLAAGRATLHRMQMDLDARVQDDIKGLETTLGADTTARVHAYLNGPLAASAQVMPRTVRKKAVQ